MVSEGVTRGRDTCLKLYQILIARAHVVYQQLPCTFILLREFYRALSKFCDRIPLGARCLQEGPFPSGWRWTFILTVRNNIGFDFILHKRQEGLCPFGELPGNDERQVMRNIIGLVVVANWKLSVLTLRSIEIHYFARPSVFEGQPSIHQFHFGKRSPEG
jgi:hypothetical protein